MNSSHSIPVHFILVILLLLLFSYLVVSYSLRPHGLQHAGPSCPSPSPRVCPSSCSLHQWCHPAISSSDDLFFCPQSFPASGEGKIIISHYLEYHKCWDPLPAKEVLSSGEWQRESWQSLKSLSDPKWCKAGEGSTQVQGGEVQGGEGGRRVLEGRRGPFALQSLHSQGHWYGPNKSS